jgi:hypothetical protein
MDQLTKWIEQFVVSYQMGARWNRLSINSFRRSTRRRDLPTAAYQQRHAMHVT